MINTQYLPKLMPYDEIIPLVQKHEEDNGFWNYVDFWAPLMHLRNGLELAKTDFFPLAQKLLKQSALTYGNGAEYSIESSQNQDILRLEFKEGLAKVYQSHKIFVWDGDEEWPCKISADFLTEAVAFYSNVDDARISIYFSHIYRPGTNQPERHHDLFSESEYVYEMEPIEGFSERFASQQQEISDAILEILNEKLNLEQLNN